MIPYMETDTDKGESCKRFTDLPQICYGSPTECYGDRRTGLWIKKQSKGHPQTCPWVTIAFRRTSVADPVRSV